jgi:hypothetical protein
MFWKQFSGGRLERKMELTPDTNLNRGKRFSVHKLERKMKPTSRQGQEGPTHCGNQRIEASERAVKIRQKETHILQIGSFHFTVQIKPERRH